LRRAWIIGRRIWTRLVITLLYELRRRRKKYGLATACIGGGQGIAMIVESLN
jgi:acetyl-CoA C-acetyltransferase